MQYRQLGATHVTLEILKLRPTFIVHFDEAWQKARIDLHARTAAYKINDRIEKNWLFPLSAFLAIKAEIDCPFSYEKLLDVCAIGVIRQNEMISKTDEVAGFWEQFNANGQPIQVYIEKENKYKTIYQQDRPLCFDYMLIQERFSIDLQTVVGDQPIEKEPDREEEALPF